MIIRSLFLTLTLLFCINNAEAGRNKGHHAPVNRGNNPPVIVPVPIPVLVNPQLTLQQQYLLQQQRLVYQYLLQQQRLAYQYQLQQQQQIQREMLITQYLQWRMMTFGY